MCYYKGAYRMNTYNGKERGWIRGCPSTSKTYNTWKNIINTKIQEHEEHQEKN